MCNVSTRFLELDNPYVRKRSMKVDIDKNLHNIINYFLTTFKL